MDLMEVTEKERLSREDAAARLHAIADALAKHNDIEFDRGGMHFKVHVPDEVDFKLEIEIEDDEGNSKSSSNGERSARSPPTVKHARGSNPAAHPASPLLHWAEVAAVHSAHSRRVVAGRGAGRSRPAVRRRPT